MNSAKLAPSLMETEILVPSGEKVLPMTITLTSLQEFPYREIPLGVAGVYLAFDTSMSCLYVGQSQDIQRRWIGHHIHSKISGRFYIGWIEVPEVQARLELESTLIKGLRPEFNISGKYSDKLKFLKHQPSKAREIIIDPEDSFDETIREFWGKAYYQIEDIPDDFHDTHLIVGKVSLSDGSSSRWVVAKPSRQKGKRRRVSKTTTYDADLLDQVMNYMEETGLNLTDFVEAAIKEFLNART